MASKYFFLGALSVLGFIVVIQNTQMTTLKFLFWDLSMSRILLVLFFLVIGFLWGFLAGKKRK